MMIWGSQNSASSDIDGEQVESISEGKRVSNWKGECRNLNVHIHSRQINKSDFVVAPQHPIEWMVFTCSPSIHRFAFFFPAKLPH